MSGKVTVDWVFHVLGLLSKGLKTRDRTDLQKKQNNFIQSQVRVQIRERSPAKIVSGPQERVFKGSRQQLTLHMACRKEELVNKGCILGGSLLTDRLGHIFTFLTVHVCLFLDCITRTASYAQARLVSRRFSLKGRTRLHLTGNIYKTSAGQISSPPLFFFFICGYVGNILGQKLFDCYQFQVWKCILWLGDGSRCTLLQGDAEPQTKWESRGLNHSCTGLLQKSVTPVLV